MTINQLEKELKENKLSSIYLLYGQERYLLDNVVKKIKKSFGNLVDGLNYIKIDNSAIDNIISEIQTPALGFERKLIIIKNTDLLKKQSKKKNQLIIDKIEKILNVDLDDLSVCLELKLAFIILDFRNSRKN